jgi:hypothetical protein
MQWHARNGREGNASCHRTAGGGAGIRRGARWVVRGVAAAALALAVAAPAGAQGSDSVRAEHPCLRFAFGTWSPPLEWGMAGHLGDATETGSYIRNARDSIYMQGKGSESAHRDGMVWDEQSGGRRLLLFPIWWPAGVSVEFNGASLARDTLSGTATAFVANGAKQRPVTSVRALRVACGGRR